MRNLKMISLTMLAALGASSAMAAKPTPGSLESQLKDLTLPSNMAPNSVRTEKLYAVQNRYGSLVKKSELSLGVARNFTGNSFVDSSQFQLAYHFHFNNRWSLALQGAYAFNSLTEGGKALEQYERMLPDAAYVKYRGAMLLGYNLFYGKMRLNMDKVMYFDQYIAIGPGLVQTQYATAPALVGDIGLAFWLGRQWSFRLGFQNEYYNEKRQLASSMEHHLLGHLDIGFAFGGEGS